MHRVWVGRLCTHLSTLCTLEPATRGTKERNMRLLTSGLILVLSVLILAFFSQLSAWFAYPIALSLALVGWWLYGRLYGAQRSTTPSRMCAKEKS